MTMIRSVAKTDVATIIGTVLGVVPMSGVKLRNSSGAYYRPIS